MFLQGPLCSACSRILEMKEMCAAQPSACWSLPSSLNAPPTQPFLHKAVISLKCKRESGTFLLKVFLVSEK